MNSFSSVTGVVISFRVADHCPDCACQYPLILNLNTANGPVDLTVDSNTYVVDNETVKTGDIITAFYDSSAPAPLVFPPRYQALAIVETEDGEQAVVDTFDANLLSSSGNLKLTLSNDTEILMPNGQPFFGDLAGQLLLVLYSASTRSIPAVTTPEKIIVFCQNM